MLCLLDAAGSLRNKCILMTAYGAGLRVSEVAKLRVSDIDSKKMQLFICGGEYGGTNETVGAAKLDTTRRLF